MKIRAFIAPALLLALMGAGAGPDGCSDNTDTRQAKQQEQMLAQSNNAVGMPAITNNQEKRMLKQILEARDRVITTTTYVIDLNARIHKLCDSVGYGVSAATQFTNPSRLAYDVHDSAVLPQADPNGLFSPASTEGTYIMCQNPANPKELGVVYAEPRVIVSPFLLDVK